MEQYDKLHLLLTIVHSPVEQFKYISYEFVSYKVYFIELFEILL